MKNLKFIWFCIAIASLSILFSQCKHENRTEIPFVTYVDIPAGLNPVLTHHFIIDTVRGTLVENILTAQPSFVRLIVEDGLPDLDFIEDVTLDVLGDSTVQEIAYRIGVPITGSLTVDMLASIADIKDHIIQDQFTIQLNITPRATTTNLSRVRIEFSVQAVLDEE